MQRRDQHDLGETVKSRQLVAAVGAREVADGDPVKVAIIPVDPPGEGIKLLAKLRILLNLGARGRRDLGVGNPSVQLRRVIEKPPHRLEAVRDAL